jgi:2-oxoglutarate dehydrogenase E1 component
MDKHSYLNHNPAFIEKMFQQYLKDSVSVEPGWRQFFGGFEFARKNYTVESSITSNEFKVINLIEDYRKRGHLFTKTNPVRIRRQYSPKLDIQNYGLEEKIWNMYMRHETKLVLWQQNS